MSTNTKHTPLMQQYHEIKDQYPDLILLFQVGDFYEMFYDDAKTASAILGIALTARGKNAGEDIPLCGVPVHALDRYIGRLVKAGCKVALCEQLEAPKPGTVVRRGVTRVLTPGTLVESTLLDEKSASFILSFFPSSQGWGLLFGELLTAHLYATVLPTDMQRALESELVRFFPDEILLSKKHEAASFQRLFKQAGYYTTLVDVPDISPTSEVHQWARDSFSAQINQQLQSQAAAQVALHYFYEYIKKNNRASLDQFRSIQFYSPADFLMLDGATQRNLELVAGRDGNAHTLFALMDRARTAMGSRTIKKWLVRPLVQEAVIENRLDAVACLVQSSGMMQQLRDYLSAVGDLERIVGRLALGRAQLYEYTALRSALGVVPAIRTLITAQQPCMLFSLIAQQMEDFTPLYQLLSAALEDDPTAGRIIKKGFDAHLDELRELAENSTGTLLAFEQQQQEQTGIGSLKVRYNNVQGYFIEITKTHLSAIPSHYIRQQTLQGKERYTTPELQQLEIRITRAQMELETVEKEVFERVRQSAASHISSLRKLSYALAHLDALYSLADVARCNGYTRPEIKTAGAIQITQGRHPVVEAVADHAFVANDLLLDDSQSLLIITGPNMGGKSTYLRQVALMCIMAQCGSFVPAKAMSTVILDRVFTRIGAGDSLAEGKSTFLVEMEETATICTQATERSLVILDEVGRGTSTFDGLAIAQAVVEYLYQVVRARCLFATHYHELTLLEEQYPSIVNYYAASKKTDRGIIFLYSMIKGVADGSFGIDVARLASIPPAIIDRSRILLKQYGAAQAGPHIVHGAQQEVYVPAMVEERRELQEQLASMRQKVEQQKRLKERIEQISFDDLSPRQAFDILWALQAELKA